MTDHDRLHPLRPFLKNWIWEHGRIGTRYLDCVDGEIKFDEPIFLSWPSRKCGKLKPDKGLSGTRRITQWVRQNLSRKRW